MFSWYDRIYCQKSHSAILVFLLATHLGTIATNLEIFLLRESYTYFNKDWWRVFGREIGEKYVDASQRKTDSFNHIFTFPIYFRSSHSYFFDSTEEFTRCMPTFLVVIIPICYFASCAYLPNPFYGFYSFFNRNFAKISWSFPWRARATRSYEEHMLLLRLAFAGKSSLIFPLQTKLSSPLSAGGVCESDLTWPPYNQSEHCFPLPKGWSQE